MINFKELRTTQKITLALLAGIIIIVTLFGSYKLLKTNFVMLYQNNELTNVSNVTQQLQEQGVEFQLSNQGHTVLVPEQQLNQLKVEMAQNELQMGRSPGFELFDKADYSMTENSQKITFQRALQGELEATLKSYSEIVDARVHLSIPEKRLFTSVQNPVKASVSLWIKPNSHINDKQVKGIQQLIASSVEGLLVDEVKVLNSTGTLLTQLHSNENNYAVASQGTEKIEQMMTSKAMRLLAIYFPQSKVAVSVTAKINRTQKKQVIKSLLLNANNQGVITKKKESITAEKSDSNVANIEKNKNLEVEYDHGVQTSETIFLPGEISQLSVAIAIISNESTDIQNKIHNLIFAGLGLDKSRGDQLSVELLPQQKTLLPLQINQPQTKLTSETVKHKVITTATKKAQLSIEMVIFIISVLVLFIGSSIYLYRRKSLSQKQRELVTLQFKDWLNAEGVVNHVC